MMNTAGGQENHERFKELCALAGSGSLAPLELSELKLHLETCEECQDLFQQYRVLATEGLAYLADEDRESLASAAWDESSARRRLMARVRSEERDWFERAITEPTVQAPSFIRRVSTRPLFRLALAAGLIVAVASTTYHLGRRSQERPMSLVVPAPVAPHFQQLSKEKQATDNLVGAEERRVSELEQERSQKEQELERLRAALREVEDHAKDLTTANAQSQEELQALAQQRDALNAQLQTTTEAYEKSRSELASLQSERDETILRTASLEGRVNELAAVNRDQDQRLKNAEQFLSSDRDIRELMGARKLYIADVFDVDGSSRTQKPYGRVFYTQGKSLIFYAFDLDRQPKAINASTFQVWGQRETPIGEQATPMNLGILYMDSEANRRWVMRFDDPKQLAEIDAVFVTVEPRGGSQKPTSKPFLYALLRNEANHP